MGNENKARPELTIDILGGPQTFKFTTWSLAQFKNLTGINLNQGEKGGVDTADPTQMIALIWIGLISYQPKYDGFFIRQGEPPENVRKCLRDIGIEMSGERIPELSELVVKAWDAAFLSGKTTDGATSEKK